MSGFTWGLCENAFYHKLFIIIYVGAIAVLFLFLIMMIDIKLKNLSKNVIVYFSTGSLFILIIFVLIFEKISILNSNNTNSKKCINLNYYLNWYEIISRLNELQIYSYILYSYFILQFLLTGLILLVVFILIVHFTKIKFNKQHQFVLKQISMDSNFYI